MDSDDEKPRWGNTREWISFLNLSFFSCVYFLWSACLFFTLSSTSSAASSYSSPFYSRILDRGSESSLLLYKLISIWCVWFFYCYYFAEHFSFIASFEIRISNIRNDVIRIKCWMKQGFQSNMKIMLDEPENIGWKICSQSNFHLTRFLFIQHDFFFFLLF